jgi:hypothetical protein
MAFVRCGLRGANDRKESFMTYYDTQQQNPQSQLNPQQWGQFNQPLNQPSMQGAGYGLGQAAYGQQYGQYGAQPSFGAFGHNAGWGAQGMGQQQPQWAGWGAQPQGFGQQQPQGAGWGAQPQGFGQQQAGWGAQGFGQQQPQGFGQQQRQLSPQDVSEAVRQLLPQLPHILAQAQQPQAGIGYAAYGQAPRMLSQQDVNEVVRQILPIVPQIVGMLQGQPQLQYAALQGGQSPFQYGAPQFQSAFGASTHGSTFGGQQQRQLSQQDVADVTRQLVGLIPQVIGNLQAFNQQRMI